MLDLYKPQTVDEVLPIVEAALEAKSPLEVLGRASKRALGRPSQTAAGLDLSELSGVTLYEPEELVLQALPGTPMAEIQGLLDENRQIMAFEPPDFGALLGGVSDQGSLGGALACNLAGPRRLKSGAARDHFLGVEGVSGRGEFFKAGGRVVKNVTGYDVMKLLAGSYGTLAVMTQITIKVLPRPEKTYSLLLFGLDHHGARTAMARALQSPHEVSAAAHLPAGLSGASTVSYVKDSGSSVTAIRVEGPGPSVQHRSDSLRRELSDLAESEILHSHNSLTFWREIGNLHPLCGETQRRVWRLSMPPAQSGAVAERLLEAFPSADLLFDWGGGLLWLGLPPSEDDNHASVRSALGSDNGHATLFKAPETLRAAVPVFQPQAPALQSLSQRIKGSFDPAGILNPGRLYQDY
ncbi:MAG: FAD-binding protein [Pseudomonadota bacterium]